MSEPAPPISVVQVRKLSGTKFRQMLRAGEDIPDWFAFPEVVAVLRAHAAATNCATAVPPPADPPRPPATPAGAACAGGLLRTATHRRSGAVSESLQDGEPRKKAFAG